MERRFGRRVVGDEARRAEPADLDAAEQVGLGARHAQQAGRLEGGALAEDLLVGLEAHLGAAPVLDGAEALELALRRAAAELHGVELLAARDLHLQLLGERVDDGDADAVQAARGVVDLAVELAARVQRGHDHFEGGLALELGMRVDRNAAAVVRDAEEAVLLDASPRSRWRGRPRPRPCNCRSPRRTGDAGPSRRCRRRTCRAGAARARGLPAPRCRRPCSSRSCRRACGRHEPLSLSPPASLPALALAGLLPSRPSGFSRGFAGRERPAPPPASASSLVTCFLGLAALGLVGFAEQVAQGPERKAGMGVLARCWRRCIAVQANATHPGAASHGESPNLSRGSRRMGCRGWQGCARQHLADVAASILGSDPRVRSSWWKHFGFHPRT